MQNLPVWECILAAFIVGSQDFAQGIQQLQVVVTKAWVTVLHNRASTCNKKIAVKIMISGW